MGKEIISKKDRESFAEAQRVNKQIFSDITVFNKEFIKGVDQIRSRLRAFGFPEEHFHDEVEANKWVSRLDFLKSNDAKYTFFNGLKRLHILSNLDKSFSSAIRCFVLCNKIERIPTNAHIHIDGATKEVSVKSNNAHVRSREGAATIRMYNWILKLMNPKKAKGNNYRQNAELDREIIKNLDLKKTGKFFDKNETTPPSNTEILERSYYEMGEDSIDNVEKNEEKNSNLVRKKKERSKKHKAA
jgi:hypothetical protein